MADEMKTGAGYPTWSDLLILIGVFVVATLISVFVKVLLVKTGSVSDDFGTLIVYLLQFGVAGVFALMQRKKALPRSEPLLKWGFRDVNFAVILWGLILMLTISVIIEPLLMVMPSEYLELLRNSMNTGGWMIVLAVLVAPLLEEVLFRGILQESLTAKYRPLRGALIASAVFGVVHIIPQQVVNAFFAGIVLGYVYYMTQSLINVMIIHALNNALAFFLNMFDTEGKGLMTFREMLNNDAAYYVLYAISCIIVIISAVGVMLAVKGRIARREELAAKKINKIDKTDTIVEN